MQQIYTQWFAAVYGADNYSECAYSVAQAACKAASDNSANGSELAGTGMSITLVITIAAVLIAASIVIMLLSRRKG